LLVIKGLAKLLLKLIGEINMSIFEAVIPTLIIKTPAESRELAIKLARKTIAAIQPDEATRKKLRPAYAEDSALLISAGQVVTIEF
jgi:nucleoside diphosphate kinase